MVYGILLPSYNGLIPDSGGELAGNMGGKTGRTIEAYEKDQKAL